MRRLDTATLEAALREQQELNLRLGEVLVERGALSREDLDEALRVQEGAGQEGLVQARRRLGERLLAQGRVTREQLQEALAAQSLGEAKIGEILVELGYVSTEDVNRALKGTDAWGSVARRAAGTSPLETAPLQGRTAPLPESVRQEARASFAEVFGRPPEPQELEAFRGRLAAATMRDRQALLFRNIVVDRMAKVVGGDMAKLVQDAGGVLRLEGLSPEDLGLAERLAVAPDFEASKAAVAFASRSLRASFRRAIGRDLAAGSEEAFWSGLWADGDAAAFLEAWQKAWQRFLADYPYLRGDAVALRPLLPSTDELRQALALFRARHGDDLFAALMAGAYFNARRIEAMRLEQGQRELVTGQREGQLRKKLEQLLAEFLGSVPPALVAVLGKWIEAAGGGLTADGPAVLERLLVDLIERLMAMLERMGGADPGRLGQALEAALEMLASGLTLDDKLLEALIREAPAAGAEAAQDPVASAREQVGQLLFECSGHLPGPAAADDPLVKSLVSGRMDLDGVRELLDGAWRSGRTPFTEADAQAFVGQLNLLHRGLAFQPGPGDEWVKRLLAREVTPAEVARHWAAEVALEVP